MWLDSTKDWTWPSVDYTSSVHLKTGPSEERWWLKTTFTHPNNPLGQEMNV